MDTQSHPDAEAEAPFGATFAAGFDLKPHEVVDPWWMHTAMRRGYSEFIYATRNTKLDELEATTLDGLLPEGARIVRRSFLTRMGKQAAVVEFEDALAVLELEQWHVWVAVAANDPKQAEDVKDLLIGSFPEQELEPDSAPFVPLTVWTAGRSASDAARMGRLDVHAWSEIAANYAPATGTGLQRLFEGFTPGLGGKLLLWHGVPGTGKSHALGALAHAWRSWCAVHYVADPEYLLGDSDYLLTVLMQQPRKGKDWKLVILEDTGELLTANAREQAGQALSRLLNVTDGMLGQTSNTLFLITTNEPVSSFHEAVARPGRCASLVEFLPLPAGQASAWLQEQGSDECVTGPTTLAEMYGVVAGTPVPRKPRGPLGFAPPDGVG